MRRRISLIAGIALALGTLLIEIFVGLAANKPDWYASPIYYGFIITGLIVGFGLLWVWNETGEKTDIDELEDRMEQLFRTQTQSINRLIKEIRKDRKERRQGDGKSD